MTSKEQVFGKDKIRLNILHDVLGGLVNIGFQLDNGTVQDFASHIHKDEKRVYVFGKFNISEEVNNGDTLTIRPIMIDCPLRISFHANAHFSGKKVSVVRNNTKAVAREFEISSETTSIELIPRGKQFYEMIVTDGGEIATVPIPIRPQEESEPTGQMGEAVAHTQENSPVDDRFEGSDFNIALDGSDNLDAEPVEIKADTTSETDLEIEEETSSKPWESSEVSLDATLQQEESEIQKIEREISVIERQHIQLSRKKQSAMEHLDRIEAEYRKDYASFAQELEDCRARMEADASIIEHYKDRDITPIETILKEVSRKLEEAEDQIRVFIETKQRKTMEIENEIKSNKKQ